MTIIAIICACIMVTRPAAAFVWPVIDLSEVVSFVNSINTGLQEVTTAKNQFDNYSKTVTTVGDQVTSFTKYAADLKKTVVNISDSVTAIANNTQTIVHNTEEIIEKSNDEIEQTNKDQQENAETTVDNVNSAINDKASEKEAQEIIDQSREEAEKKHNEVIATLDNADAAIDDSMDKASETLDMLVESVNSSEVLSKEDQEGLKNETDDIKQKIAALRADAKEIIETTKNKYNEEYEQKIASAFDAYSKAIEEYYAGKISRDELDKAGVVFKASIDSMDGTVDMEQIDGLVALSREIADDIDNLSEKIKNKIGNKGGYSDDEEEMSSLSSDTFPVNSIAKQQSVFQQKHPLKYVFNFHKTYEQAYLKSIYAKQSGMDKSFLISKELACESLASVANNLHKLADLEENSSQLRECVNAAKVENPKDYEKALYKPYKLDGVYRHIIRDYSIANIGNILKTKQYAATWKNLGDGKKGKLYELKKALEDIDHKNGSYVIMGMIDIESPKLWSLIRRVDALTRSKEAVQSFEYGTTLYIDGRDNDFVQAIASQPGKVTAEDAKDKIIFPHVFLNKCKNLGGKAQDSNLTADNISVGSDPSIPSTYGKNDEVKIARAENNIFECLYMYAVSTGKGLYRGKCQMESTQVNRENTRLKRIGDNSGVECPYEDAKRGWRLNQKKAVNDATFDTLALSVVNNYKSSLDYLDPKKLKDPKKDKNIVSLQDGIKDDAATSLDIYTSGAQMNYYTTMQILTVIDADAQNQQNEILRDLGTFDYNYFGEEETGAGAV